VDDRRRARVHKLLKNYGTRVQYSVFECQLEAGRLAELRQRLKPLLDTKLDSVRAYRLCKDCLEQTVVMGERPLSEDPDYWLV
jgi:CRISPR-associated protein Cas2